MPNGNPAARLAPMLIQSRRWRRGVALEGYHHYRGTDQHESRTARVSDEPPWQAGGA
jgi:hypothetical protein